MACRRALLRRKPFKALLNWSILQHTSSSGASKHTTHGWDSEDMADMVAGNMYPTSGSEQTIHTSQLQLSHPPFVSPCAALARATNPTLAQQSATPAAATRLT